MNIYVDVLILDDFIVIDVLINYFEYKLMFSYENKLKVDNIKLVKKYL